MRSIPALLSFGVLAFFGICATGTLVRSWADRDGLAEAGQVSVTTRLIDPRLVGRWVAKDGRHILVARSGALWADPDLLGEAQFDPDTSGLRFSGRSFECQYAIRFLTSDEAEWQLKSHKGDSCPAGRFERPFTF